MNRQEFRKVAEIAGRRTTYYGDLLKDRDNYFKSRYDKAVSTYNVKFNKKVKELCKKWNIDSIRVLSTTHWIGEYGLIYNTGDCIMKDKYIYSILRTFYDERKFENWWKDEYNNYYYVPGGYIVVEDCLLKMKNGQYFDTDSWYYFSMEESYQLTKWLKEGYRYYSSQVFINDYYSDLEGSPE